MFYCFVEGRVITYMDIRKLIKDSKKRKLSQIFKIIYEKDNDSQEIPIGILTGGVKVVTHESDGEYNYYPFEIALKLFQVDRRIVTFDLFGNYIPACVYRACIEKEVLL